jgi:hypothetical protein
MSLISSRTGRTQVDAKRGRKRSESVTGIERVSRDRRNPHAGFSDEHDVATMICVELSRGIFMSPNVSTGVFFKTVSDSRRDINKSDTTLIVACAILDHIGNKVMADKLLSKSSTLSKYYQKMNLDNAEVRKLFVTMLFALSPDFASMIEKVLIIALQRSSADATAKKDESPVVSAFARLTIDKDITPTELRRAGSFDKDKELSLSPESRRFSIQNTPLEYYSPTVVDAIKESNERRRKTIKDADLIAYAGRRRSGTERDFSEVFPSAVEPVAVEVARNARKLGNRRGVGYLTTSVADANYVDAVNRILGSQNVKSVDLDTGNVRYRKPVVTDFLDSTSVSESVYNKVPDVASEYNPLPDMSEVKRPLPTEYYLPSTIAPSEVTIRPKVDRKDSFEELLKAEGGFY